VRDAILRRFLPGERTRTHANRGTKLGFIGLFLLAELLGFGAFIVFIFVFACHLLSEPVVVTDSFAIQMPVRIAAPADVTGAESPKA